MRIDEFEFQDRNGNEIEPTKNQLVVYIKSLHKQIAELQNQLEEKDKDFKFYQKLYKIEKEQNDNYRTEKYELNVKELRKLDLSFPEKEWYYKGFDNCERQASSTRAELTIEIKDLKKQLEEKEKEIETKNIINNLYKTTVSLRDNDFKDLVYENNSLKQQLKSQPAEIVEKIKNYKGEYFEWKIGDKIYPAFKITEGDLDTILKEYQK